MDPWRYSTQGISVALRVTPRGGRDDIDGWSGSPMAAPGQSARAVDGDPVKLGDTLRKLVAATKE